MTLVTPANAKGPVPVLMMFGRAGFPSPNEPRGDELDRINTAWKALLVQQDPSLERSLCAASRMGAGQGHALPVSADERRRRPAQYLATGRRRLGLRAPRSRQRAGRRRRRHHARHHRPGQQRPAAQARKTGARCAPGPGARAAASTTSRPTPPSTPNTSASKASRATARPRSSPWPSISASPWCWSARPAKAAQRCCAATSAKPSRA